MRKAIATTIIALVLACTTVALISACTSFRSDGISRFKIPDEDTVKLLTDTVTRLADAESHYRLGCNLQERNKHYLAVVEFNTAVEKDPVHLAAYNGMGISLDALEDYDNAVASYSAALKIDQNLDYVHNNLGYSYLLQDRPDLAIESFKRAVALDGKNQRYRNNLGLAYAKSGRYDDAFAEFKAASGEADAHLNIARLCYRNGLFKEAKMHFTQASVLKPSDAATDRGVAAASSLAEIHASSKKALEAKEYILAEKDEKNMDVFDNDGFSTIPAGAIEDLGDGAISQWNLFEKSYDASDAGKNEAPMYVATIAQATNPEVAKEEAGKILDEKRLKLLDEAQALELLNQDAADKAKRSKSRIKIEVSNGNGVSRMARLVGNYLRDKDFILMYLSNADHFNHEWSKIYYVSGYLREAYQLAQKLPGLQTLEEVRSIKDGNAEISILIGNDLIPYDTQFKRG
jgi:Flp pilus assembly protein TadD